MHRANNMHADSLTKQQLHFHVNNLSFEATGEIGRTADLLPPAAAAMLNIPLQEGEEDLCNGAGPTESSEGLIWGADAS